MTEQRLFSVKGSFFYWFPTLCGLNFAFIAASSAIGGDIVVPIVFGLLTVACAWVLGAAVGKVFWPKRLRFYVDFWKFMYPVWVPASQARQHRDQHTRISR